MYDEFAEVHLQQLPDLTDTDWQECRRLLSRLYFGLIQLRMNGPELGESQESIAKACDYLRRLANSMQQYLFDESVYSEEADLRRTRSYAFIAAEAIDLWCNFARRIRINGNASVDMAYAQIESALLYLASEYQVNAHCSVNEIGDNRFLHLYDDNLRDRETVSYLQNVICSFASGSLQSLPDVPTVTYNEYDPIVAARVAAMIRLGELVTSYSEWLTGRGDVNDVRLQLRYLSQALLPTSKYLVSDAFTDLLHLCTLIMHVIHSSEQQSLMHELPRLDMAVDAADEYEQYIADRASQRPFLWPSAKEYVEKCFPGPHSDAVVIVPTGSGKSFLAELACSQAMQNGWVLYLAPTNALVQQVQRDLRTAFRRFGNAQILSFVGGQEYTSVIGEQLDSPPEMSVAVMTPEKCAMAFRINPNAFHNCRLCIVDEFHTIDDEHRGMTVDLCLARITALNAETRLLLMSAMVSNGEDVADWLNGLRDGQGVPLVEIPWRPCRTLRSLLIVDREKAEEAYASAIAELSNLPASRRTVQVDAPLGLLGGMCLRWEEDGNSEDYVSVPVPFAFPGKALRDTTSVFSDRKSWSGWKNTASRLLSEKFHKCNYNVLCFILTSRHHVFSSADKCNVNESTDIDQHIVGLIGLSNSELGVPSRAGELLQRGIGVHSSAMLDTEQAAVERSFGNRSIRILFATPTLAQGLNLPADVVVVAGSSLGDPRQSDSLRGVRSSDATILNAFGRAGRAMVANQGLAVLVSDTPFFGPISEMVGVERVVQRYELLSGSDRCIEVSSPIESFIGRLSPEDTPDTFSLEELELVAQFGEDRDNNAVILSHTFGAYLAQRHQDGISVEAAAGRVRDIGVRLSEQHSMPEWMSVAAMKGGIDLLTCWRLWRSLSHLSLPSEELTTDGLEGCLSIFIKVMERMPPKDIRKLLPDSVRKMNTVLDRMLERIDGDEYAVDWEIPDDWAELWSELSRLIWMYMNGSTYADMAAAFLSCGVEEIHSRRSQGQAPIPAIFSFVGRALHHLSIYAGALLVILEESHYSSDEVGEMPLLPLCIRNGCRSRDSWAWFRYGYRNRMVAHEFAARFPIPGTTKDDGDVESWIRQRRKEWLEGDITESDAEVLKHVRLILK